MDTLKNFNRYGTVTFNYEYYENGMQIPPGPGVPTTTSQDYPYGAQPSYPQDPANFINPGEPWSDIIKTPLAPVSGNATYTIKYYYTAYVLLARRVHGPSGTVSWDPAGWFIINDGQGNQLCIADTNYGCPTLSYMTSYTGYDMTPTGALTSDQIAALEYFGADRLYMFGNTQNYVSQIQHIATPSDPLVYGYDPLQTGWQDATYTATGITSAQCQFLNHCLQNANERETPSGIRFDSSVNFGDLLTIPYSGNGQMLDWQNDPNQGPIGLHITQGPATVFMPSDYLSTYDSEYNYVPSSGFASGRSQPAPCTINVNHQGGCMASIGILRTVDPSRTYIS